VAVLGPNIESGQPPFRDSLTDEEREMQKACGLSLVRQAVDKLDDGNMFGNIEALERGTDEGTQREVIEKVAQNVGATRRIRTGDLLITNQLLYRLS
jgi:hypothetical protein